MNNLEDRTSNVAAMLRSHAVELNAPITGDGRVSEEIAAALLGVSVATLADWRRSNEAPPHYRLPINGCRVSYRIHDLAMFIEVQRDTGGCG
jgi:hypothetical protein